MRRTPENDTEAAVEAEQHAVSENSTENDDAGDAANLVESEGAGGADASDSAETEMAGEAGAFRPTKLSDSAAGFADLDGEGKMEAEALLESNAAGEEEALPATEVADSAAEFAGLDYQGETEAEAFLESGPGEEGVFAMTEVSDSAAEFAELDDGAEGPFPMTEAADSAAEFAVLDDGGEMEAEAFLESGAGEEGLFPMTEIADSAAEFAGLDYGGETEAEAFLESGPGEEGVFPMTEVADSAAEFAGLDAAPAGRSSKRRRPRHRPLSSQSDRCRLGLRRPNQRRRELSHWSSREVVTPLRGRADEIRHCCFAVMRDETSSGFAHSTHSDRRRWLAAPRRPLTPGPRCVCRDSDRPALLVRVHPDGGGLRPPLRGNRGRGLAAGQPAIELRHGVQAGRGRDDRCGPRVDRLNDLRAVDPLQIDRRDPKLGVSELALDHDQRYAFVRHLDSVSMT